MVERINLIEREPFRFTYANIVKGVGGLLFLLILVAGVQFVRLKVRQARLAGTEIKLTTLRSDVESMLKTAVPAAAATSYGQLKGLFTQAPRWGEVIRDIGGRLPGTVWLTSMKTTQATDESKSASSKKESGKTSLVAKGKGPANEILLQGKGVELEEIAQFTATLNESPYLRKAVLISSKKEGSGFAFTIRCDMIATAR